MKKNLSTIIAGLLIALTCGCGTAMANGNPFSPEMQKLLLEGASAQASVYKPVWEKLYTCTPDKTADGVLQIIGHTPDQKCHFKHTKYECRLPLDLTKQYAAAGIKSLDDIENGNFATDTAENSFMDSIHNNSEYCTSK